MLCVCGLRPRVLLVLVLAAITSSSLVAVEGVGPALPRPSVSGDCRRWNKNAVNGLGSWSRLGWINENGEGTVHAIRQRVQVFMVGSVLGVDAALGLAQRAGIGYVLFLRIRPR